MTDVYSRGNTGRCDTYTCMNIVGTITHDILSPGWKFLFLFLRAHHQTNGVLIFFFLSQLLPAVKVRSLVSQKEKSSAIVKKKNVFSGVRESFFSFLSLEFGKNPVQADPV